MVANGAASIQIFCIGDMPNSKFLFKTWKNDMRKKGNNTQKTNRGLSFQSKIRTAHIDQMGYNRYEKCYQFRKKN
jgi:hypothetical protein